MDRRRFLRTAGAGSLLWLVPLARIDRPVDTSPSAREAPPLPGLFRCATCREWRGLARTKAGPAKAVTCRCEPSVCSRCGEIVHPRRICGYYWCDERQSPIHVPWFVGMRHSCRA